MPQTFEDPSEAAAAFRTWVGRTAFADGTGKQYGDRATRFLEWITEDPEEYHDALTATNGRDYAVRRYREYLMKEKGHAVSTVEGYITAVGTFYDWLGLGRPQVKRANPARPEPKSLDDKQLNRVMGAAERRGKRDHAICTTLFYTAVRVSELADLDTTDLFVSDRKGAIEVRYGKGGIARQVSLVAEARQVLRGYLEFRRAEGHPEIGPLFYSRFGKRISTRRVQSMVADLAEETGTELTPHVFRHTFSRKFLELGGDVGELQDILGHKSLATTGVYTQPTQSQLAASMERMQIRF